MSKNTCVAVTSKSFSKHKVLREELLNVYPNAVFNNLGRNLTQVELVDFLKNAEKAIVALDTIDKELLSRVPKLKVLSKYGVGLDSLNLNALSEFGVNLGWTPGVNKTSVAELALSFALMMVRKVNVAHKMVLNGLWKQVVGNQLSGKTFGIVGFGNVGQELAKFLQPFSCRILFTDVLSLKEVGEKYSANQVSLEDLLKSSDAVSIHVPLNEQTRNLFSKDCFEQMKPNAVLINTARGNIVDENELCMRLKSRTLAAAAFDVFASEPPDNSELLGLDNFYCTPHIGGSSEEAILAMGRAAILGLDEHCKVSKYLNSNTRAIS